MNLFLTGVIAGVLGIVLGVVALVAAVPLLSPDAATVSHTITDQVRPPVYGHR